MPTEMLISAWSGLVAMIGLVVWVLVSKPQLPLKTSTALMAPIVAALLQLATMIVWFQFAERGSLLVRDAVASILVCALIPYCVLVSLRGLPSMGVSRSVALAYGTLCGLILALISPILILAVHCTSGDCL